ncbi:hypothetical protein QTN25_000563 [Entamoeba marina]
MQGELNTNNHKDIPNQVYNIKDNKNWYNRIKKSGEREKIFRITKEIYLFHPMVEGKEIIETLRRSLKILKEEDEKKKDERLEKIEHHYFDIKTENFTNGKKLDDIYKIVFSINEVLKSVREDDQKFTDIYVYFKCLIHYFGNGNDNSGKIGGKQLCKTIIGHYLEQYKMRDEPSEYEKGDLSENPVINIQVTLAEWYNNATKRVILRDRNKIQFLDLEIKSSYENGKILNKGNISFRLSIDSLPFEKKGCNLKVRITPELLKTKRIVHPTGKVFPLEINNIKNEIRCQGYGFKNENGTVGDFIIDYRAVIHIKSDLIELGDKKKR